MLLKSSGPSRPTEGQAGGRWARGPGRESEEQLRPSKERRRRRRVKGWESSSLLTISLNHNVVKISLHFNNNFRDLSRAQAPCGVRASCFFPATDRACKISPERVCQEERKGENCTAAAQTQKKAKRATRAHLVLLIEGSDFA